ncbi:MAG: hypothetical protein M3Q40_04130 [Pseudomonadota bacterium]|nr:hypothetical protein [Pseudomonadota bacterium]
METTTPSTRHPAINAKAAVWAGVIAGLVFVMLEMMMVAMFLGGSPWGPPRMIAAIAMGRDVLPPPATFDLTILMVAMAIHLVLSIILAFVFALIVKGRPLGTTVIIGAVFGLALYLINFYLMTAVFPWFAEARNWVSIFVHIVFGVVLGWVYAGFSRPRPVR